MQEKSILKVKEDDLKKFLHRSFSRRRAFSDEHIAIVGLRAESLIERPTKYARIGISDVVTQPDIGIPQQFLFHAYCNGPQYHHEYRKEQMMLQLGCDLTCQFEESRRMSVYLPSYGFDDDSTSILKAHSSGKTLRKLALEKRVAWEEMENALSSLALLHSYTPFITHPRKEHVLSYPIDIVSAVDMGNLFAQDVAQLLKGAAKPIDDDASKTIQDRFRRLAEHFLYRPGLKGVIHGSLDLESLTPNEILYAGDIKIGSFFCDLAIFLDPALLSSLDFRIIDERMDHIRLAYKEQLEKIDAANKKRMNQLSNSPLFSHCSGDMVEFVAGLELAGIWSGVKRSREKYHYHSCYAFLADVVPGAKEEIEKDIRDNIQLSEKLLSSLCRHQEYGLRATELHDALRKIKFFDDYELKYPGTVAPLSVEITRGSTS